MATKYSDIITIREGKSAYNIANEEGAQWTSSIANIQFNDILKTIIKSVRNISHSCLLKTNSAVR